MTKFCNRENLYNFLAICTIKSLYFFFCDLVEKKTKSEKKKYRVARGETTLDA